MPPIEVGPTRAVGAVSAEIARKSGLDTNTAAVSSATTNKSAAPAGEARVAVAASDALKAGEAPVNAERVAQIRTAVESGQYPLVPARIADAMIAAGILLRTSKA